MRRTTSHRPASDRLASTMTAVVQDTYGTVPAELLRLEQVPRPTPGAGEVLIRVAAASVDLGTVHLMTGLPRIMRIMGFGLRRPSQSNPGRAFAGVVESVGSEVTGLATGQAVYGSGDGSFAEYLAAPAKQVALAPANLTPEQAAAVPISGVTALQAIRKAQVSQGERVLILGASGGVGTFAVQIAKALGAEVTGVSSGAKADLVRTLGADHVIDYRAQDPTDGTRTYDVIIDIVGNHRLSHLRRSLTRTGTLVIVGVESGGTWVGGLDRQLRAGLLSPIVTQRLGMLASKENAADLDAVRGLIESGAVAPAIDRSYPLGDVAEAITYFNEGQVRGKLVIAVKAAPPTPL